MNILIVSGDLNSLNPSLGEERKVKVRSSYQDSVVVATEKVTYGFSEDGLWSEIDRLESSYRYYDNGYLRAIIRSDGKNEYFDEMPSIDELLIHE